MQKTVTYAPPYSIAFVSGPKGYQPPLPTSNKLGQILSTPSCVSFPVLMSQDGPTRFTLGDFREVMPQRVPAQAPVFDGMIDTPDKHIIVSSAEDVTFLEMPVRTKKTRVRIWTNHPTEPDEVIIGVE
jgi:hypothetical protein